MGGNRRHQRWSPVARDVAVGSEMVMFMWWCICIYMYRWCVFLLLCISAKEEYGCFVEKL